MKKESLIIFTPFLALIFLYGYLIEPYNPELVEQTLVYQDLPYSLDNLKIIHLSDFHCRGFTAREKKLVEIIDKERPDFIFFTGDFLENDKWIYSCENLIWQIFQKNSNFFGVFGNHDHQINTPIQDLEEDFEKRGITILVNEAQELKFKGSSFYLIGVDDPYLDYDNLELALTGVKEDKFKILLSHSPAIFMEDRELILDNAINLILSGHTHGGQVNVPFFTNFFISLWLGGKYTAGLFREGGTFIYVNRGIGTFHLFPIRLNSPPEVTLIILKRK